MDPASSTYALAQPRTIIWQPQPESALVLPYTDLDTALLVLSLSVLFGFSCKDNFSSNSSTQGYILEILKISQHEWVSFMCRVACVIIRHDAFLIIWHVMPYFAVRSL